MSTYDALKSAALEFIDGVTDNKEQREVLRSMMDTAYQVGHTEASMNAILKFPRFSNQLVQEISLEKGDRDEEIVDAAINACAEVARDHREVGKEASALIAEECAQAILEVAHKKAYIDPEPVF